MSEDWWRGSVTYQVYPRSFQDANGDGIGDLPGITQRLPYLADLGVDAVWLSPVCTSPMKDMGYDVSNYRDIDPVFGTLDDFDGMVERAHDLGLRIIIDQVISHSSNLHPAFIESRANPAGPKGDWYVWADPKPDGSPPNNWLAAFGGSAWTWNAHRHQYYLHNFLPEQPDFNFHNPEVQDFHLDNMAFWLDRGVDGFRLDTVNYYFHDALLRDDAADFRRKEKPENNPYNMQYHLFSKNQPENLAFLERMRALTDRYEARVLIGEMGESHHAIEMMGQYTTGARLHQSYSFDMLGPDFSAEHFRTRIAGFFAGAPQGWPCWAFSNHDVNRHVSRWMRHAADRESLAKQAAALLLSMQGSICIYQGEELGQTETELSFEELTDPAGINFWPEEKGRDGCRTPMVWEKDAANAGFSNANRTWLPVREPQRAVAVDTHGGEDSVLAFYKRMLAFRKNSVDLMKGASDFLVLPEPWLGFRRGENTLCIFNLSAEARSLPCEGGELVLSHNANVEKGALALGPNGFAIMSGNPTIRQPD
ncbi:alpha-glucosidase [Silicimonas algicola]|uniref:Alpha-glucosidase n=1 Tax=Silicimonas algicola TaxID=1826607 RepID=A0A316GBG0_9RHOB|nr:alpha-amylase family glycosyl hydrolase [Silicimonas algicola]AZQ65953.1 alpha-glucosidase [Silicimonas algicola]PWK58238.1 alpha-glucosidase [Silicimonas algicola]